MTEDVTRPKASEVGCSVCTQKESHILVLSEHALVSVSPQGVRPGHLLVASRRHVESFAELNDAEVYGLMRVLAETVIVAERVMRAERYHILRIGDKAPHLHFHLIPRMTGDEKLGPFVFGERGWAGSVARPISDQDLEAFIRSFKATTARNHAFEHD